MNPSIDFVQRILESTLWVWCKSHQWMVFLLSPIPFILLLLYTEHITKGHKRGRPWY